MRKFKSKMVYFPDVRLLTPCQPINFQFWTEEKLKGLFREMVNEMVNIKGFFQNNCVGISANQLGYDLSVFVISRCPRNEKLKNKFHDIYINPQIIKVSEETSLKWEGCISEPKHLLLIRRPNQVVLSYQDLNGEKKTEVLSNYKSRIVLHELDHINGVNINKLEYYSEKQDIKPLNDSEYLKKWSEIQLEKEYLI
jgi:peptide deformylase